MCSLTFFSPYPAPNGVHLSLIKPLLAALKTNRDNDQHAKTNIDQVNHTQCSSSSAVTMKEKMLIFLDFDGVLHPLPRVGEPFFCRVKLLWQIMRAYPGVQVVFSSSWRNFHVFDELVEFVTSGGGEDLSSRFIGFTPNIKAETYRGQRDIEIKYWLDTNKHHGEWIAIDDMPDLFFEEMEEIGEHPNLYVVDCKTGLTDMDVTKLIERLIFMDSIRRVS